MRTDLGDWRRRGLGWALRSYDFARAEFLVLALVFVVAAGLWTFVSLAGEIREGETARFDAAVLLAFRNPADPADPLGPVWLEEMVRDVTALGGAFVRTFITLAVVGFLALAGKRGSALLVIVSTAGGALVGDGLKFMFERPRPDLVPHGMQVYTSSFPSNHAMGAAVTYLTLGALLARLEVNRLVKVYVLSVAVLLTVLIGLSRIYLGVHWPTDVLAGWAVGAAWAMGVWLVALWLQRRGAVEGISAAGPVRGTPAP